MEQGFTIAGASLAAAWKNFRPLLKIWLTTWIIYSILQGLLTIPYYRGMITATIATTTGEVAATYTPGAGYLLLIALLSFASIFVLTGLMVNSWRFLNGEHTPSWVPFNIDWRTSLAVFGYYLLFFFFFFLIIFIIALVLGISAYGISIGFADAEIVGTITMGKRFVMALGFFGVLAAFLAFIWSMIWLYRASLVLVDRALNPTSSLNAVLTPTKSKFWVFFWTSFASTSVFVAVVLGMYFFVFLAFLIPVAIFFFLPTIGAVLGGILAVIVYIATALFLTFFSVTLMKELHHRFISN